jgi:formylmethanofuran dehydrogenase subunit E
MGSHERKKMYYWYLQNQKPPLELNKKYTRKCQKCGRIVLSTEIMMINICKTCYDKNMEKIGENMKKLREKK